MAKAPKSEFVQHSLFGATSEIAPKAPIELLDRRDVTLLSLFNGISGARLACERAGLKITKHWISEIDPYANQITMDHYPDSIQLGDVTKWRDWNLDELRGVDYMIFGSPCFVSGTKVLTSTGYKDIDAVVVGDLVLTHKNRFMPVLKTGFTYSPTVLLTAQGMFPTETTAEHPYYVREMKRKHNSLTGANPRTFSSLEWKPVGKLTSSDYLSFPVLDFEENALDLDLQDCWLLGRYLADGYYRKERRPNRKNSFQNQFILSVGSSKVDYVRSKITKYHCSIYPHTSSTYRVVISSEALVDLTIASGIGKGAVNKTIPFKILSLPVPLLKEFIDGYMSGDGSYSPLTDKYRASSVSKELIMALSLAIAKVYKVNSNLHSYERSDSCVIEGRTVNQRRAYEVHFREQMQPQSHAVIMENFIHSPVKSVVSTNKIKQVFNLEVAEDNSYTANNAVVHNCTDLSISKSNRKSLDGEHSGLFWAALDILREIKPKYFIMENVASMTDEAMDIISAELGVHCRLLNSALVSGQNRARLYWSNATIGNVEDKGILLQDILESGSAVKEKSYNLTQNNYTPKDFFEKSKGCVIFEGPVVDRKKSYCLDASYWKGSNGVKGYLEKGKRHVVFLPVNKSIQIGNINNSKSQGNRVYSVKGKSVSLCANAGGLGAKTGLYKVDLPDGNYIIRKLTPTECERLQNYPDGWTAGISKTQRYKCLGNSFTVDIIAHIVKQTLKLS